MCFFYRGGIQIVVRRLVIPSTWKRQRRSSRIYKKPILVISLCTRLEFDLDYVKMFVLKKDGFFLRFL